MKIINKNAVLYCRMSTDKQEYSIESQKRLLFEYADKNNFNIIKCFEDKGISGREASKRPAFMEMIEDSYNKNFEHLLIYDSSRFARNLEQSLIYKSVLKKNNVEIISITEPSINDDSQILTDAIIGAMNEMYSLKLSKVVKRGMQEKALKGEYISQAPFGYTKPKGKGLEINKDEAEIVLKIFNDFINNKSSYSIAKNLNKINIKTKRGNNIDTRFINKILSNPTYKGYYKFKSDNKTILTKSNHEAIISEELFEKVQIIIEEKKTLYLNNNIKNNKPLEYNKHWLCGLVRCNTCGNIYVYAKYYKNRQDRFRCGGYTTGKCENSFSIGVYDLEEIVINKIRENFPNVEYKLDIDSNNNITNNLTLENKNIKMELKKYKKGLLKSKQAYLLEVDTIEEYKENKEYFNKEIEFLENKLKNNIKNIKNQANNNSKDNSKDNENYISLIKELLNKENSNNNYLAKLLINKIKINNNSNNLNNLNNNIKIDIYFNFYL